MNKKKYRRKQYVIKPLFQIKISTIIAFTLILAALVTASFMYFNILNSILPEFSVESLKQKLEVSTTLRQQQLSQYTQDAEDQRMLEMLFPETAKMLSSYEQQVIMNILHEVNRNLIPWVLILVSLILAAGIFISHRIAGPIYRFEKTAEEIKSGNLQTRVHLRWADEFKELAAKLNEALSSLDNSISQAQSIIDNIEKSPKQKADLSKLRELLDYYQTSHKK